MPTRSPAVFLDKTSPISVIYPHRQLLHTDTADHTFNRRVKCFRRKSRRAV
uniref:Uncharacterized protein n=1 Tax=Rhizophora mucronata TaxID=61149 RepID=A0A2P2QUR2_RHIMU